MQNNFIAVMGATGNTGKKITEALLEAGERVRALGRSTSKLAELKRTGAEVLAGDTNEAAFLANAFRVRTQFIRCFRLISGRPTIAPSKIDRVRRS